MKQTVVKKVRCCVIMTADLNKFNSVVLIGIRIRKMLGSGDLKMHLEICCGIIILAFLSNRIYIEGINIILYLIG